MLISIIHAMLRPKKKDFKPKNSRTMMSAITPWRTLILGSLFLICSLTIATPVSAIKNTTTAHRMSGAATSPGLSAL